MAKKQNADPTATGDPEQTANPVGHVPVAYPSLTDGFESVQHLANDVLGSGQRETLNVMVAQSWVVLGTGLSQLLPPETAPTPQAAGPGPVAGVGLSADQRALLQRFAATDRAEAEAAGVDWKALAKIALQIILGLLG